MDEALKTYADSLYEQALKESLNVLNEQRRLLGEKAARRDPTLPLSGIEAQRIARLSVTHIGRAMRARLNSYKTAYEESGIAPDEEALRQVWAEVEQIQEMHVMHSARYVNEFAKARGLSIDLIETIRNSSGHAHDELLNEWKVWRAQNRLKARPSKAIKHPRLSASTEYCFHKDIETVSRELYDDGHFKSAVLEAFVCVINRVKKDSKLSTMDGDKLINRVFGPYQEGGPRLRF